MANAVTLENIDLSSWNILYVNDTVCGRMVITQDPTYD
jgi:hypothetical protein